MNTTYETRLADFIHAHTIEAEQLIFQQSTHSVAEAALAVSATPEDFVKSICFISKTNQIVVAIVKGEDRADRVKVQDAAGLGKLSIASPAEMLMLTGYPAGGTPPFGFDATFLMDERVFEKAVIYAGGGSEQALIRVTPMELQRANGAAAAVLRK
jgi:Cys-tRNA(Pro)/Cys-tRNA(Cys) deacylase